MNVMGQIVLGLIKSDQTKFAKELVPQLRLNSTYTTIQKNATKSTHYLYKEVLFIEQIMYVEVVIVKCSKSNIEHKGSSKLNAVEIYKRNYKN